MILLSAKDNNPRVVTFDCGGHDVLVVMTLMEMRMMILLIMLWVQQRKFNDGGDDPSVVSLDPPAIDARP